MNVRFFAGTRAQYDSLPAPRNPLGLYFCEDTKELFWADRLLTDGIRVVPTHDDLPELSAAADGVVYYITETRNGYTLSPDRREWLQTIYAPATDAYRVPESEYYNTVTTVGAVRDIENRIYSDVNRLERRIANIEIGSTESGVESIYFAGVKFDKLNGTYTMDRLCALRALGFVLPEDQAEDEEVELITKEYVDNKISAFESIYAKKADLESLASTEYVDEKVASIDIPEVPTKISAFENDLGYITEHQDISNLATKDEVRIVSSAIDAVAASNNTAHAAINETKQALTTKADADHTHDDLYDAKGAAEAVKNDLLNGAGAAFDSLKELGDLISTNADTIDALTLIASNKADKDHEHEQYLTSRDLDAITSHVDDKIATIKVPTKVSELDNDADYITVADIPDTSALATKEELAAAVADKVNDILFVEDYRVGNAIGQFAEKETVQNMTISQIITKLLGLTLYVPPAENLPEGTTPTVEDIIINEAPIHVLGEDGGIVELAFEYKILTPAEAKANDQVNSYFYQVVDPNTDELVESGYHVTTIYQENDFLTILIPNTITKFHVKDYNTLAGDWTQPDWKLERNDNYSVDGYVAYTVPENFEITSGIAIRVIIEN